MFTRPHFGLPDRGIFGAEAFGPKNDQPELGEPVTRESTLASTDEEGKPS